MSNLTDFLLARIAEDEAAAREAQEWTYQQEAEWWAEGEWWLEGVCMSTIGSGHTGSHIVGYSYSDQTAEHIARHDPARVLAECEAKRRIVERLAQAERLCKANAEKHAEASRGGLANQEQITALRTHGWELSGRRDALRYAVDEIALPYADHPDYDEAWRP